MPAEDLVDVVTDWSTLEDAMTTAEAVPGLIAALHAPRKRDRLAAFEELADERLVHQGDGRWPATLAAVPLLLQQLDAPGYHPGRSLVLALLATIAVGSPEAYAAGGWGCPPLADLVADPGLFGSCFRAVAAGAQRYEALLDHVEPSVRAYAALPLALVAPARAVSSLTEKVTQEPDDATRVAWLIAVGVAAKLGGLHPTVPRVTGEPAVDVAASVARTLAGVDADDARLEANELAPGLMAPLAKTTTPFGALERVVLGALIALGAAGRAAIADAFDRTPVEARISIAHALILAGVPGADMMQPRVPLRPSRSFPKEVLDVVRLVTERAPERYTWAPLVHLRPVGMPTWIPDLRRYVGIDPPGPLEGLVSWRGSQVEAIIPLETLALGEAGEAEVRTVLLAGRSPEERVAMALAAANDDYELHFRSPSWKLNSAILFAVSLLDDEACLPALEAKTSALRSLSDDARWALAIATHRLRGRMGAPFLRDLVPVLWEHGIANYAREELVDWLRAFIADAPADVRDKFALEMPFETEITAVDKIRGHRVGHAYKAWYVLDLAADRQAAARRGVESVAAWTAKMSLPFYERPVEAAERALRALLPEAREAFEELKGSATPYGRALLEGMLKVV